MSRVIDSDHKSGAARPYSTDQMQQEICSGVLLSALDSMITRSRSLSEQEQLVLHDAVLDGSLGGETRQFEAGLQRVREGFLQVHAFARADGAPHRIRARRCRLRIEVDGCLTIGETPVQVGAPPRQPKLFRQRGDLVGAGPDERRRYCVGRAATRRLSASATIGSFPC